MAAKTEYGRVATGIEALKDKIKIDDSWKYFQNPAATPDLDQAYVNLTQVENKHTFYNSLLTSRTATDFKKLFKCGRDLLDAVGLNLPEFVDAVYNADTELQMTNDTYNSRQLVQAPKAKAMAAIIAAAEPAAKQPRRKRRRASPTHYWEMEPNTHKIK